MAETGNAINLLVQLGIDTSSSKANLDTQIEKLSKQLKNLDLKVDIDKNTLTALNDLSKMDLKGLSDSIKGVGKGIGGLGDEAKNTGNEIKKTYSEMQKSIEANFKHLGKDFQQVMTKGIQEVDELKKAFKGMEATFNMDWKVVGQQATGEQIRRVKAIEASFKNLQGQMEKVKFEKLSIDTSTFDKEGTENYWVPSSTSKVIDAQMKQIEASTEKARQELVKLGETGKVTLKQMDSLYGSLNSVKDSSGLDQYKNKLKDVLTTNKQIADTQKQQTTEKKEQLAVEERIRKLQNSIITTQKRDPRGMGRNTELSGMLDSLNKINPSAKDASEAVKGISNSFERMKAEATVAGRESLGVVESFKIAMEKFPVWMAASTVFFGAVRTAREFMTIIVDIDTKMTDLRKVMSDDTNFEAVFDRATLSAERFGQTISNVMDSYIEFAKQGYSDDELGLLADAAVIAGNVGDITAQQASEYMTASLTQWKKDASDAMGIIDQWNSISNEYATTVEKMAQGQARSGATARAMGLEFEQVNAIIGSVTAATKQSGNEVGNFLKNVLPRLVGQPAQDALNSLDISLTDSDGNMRDIIEVYTEVANKVKDISDTERIAVVEGLAGKFHISRMQALLDDLGSVDSMYRSMMETSANSAGSAIEENEQYLKSLEARMNLARVEVEKLALAIGDAFLTEGMIQGIKVFSEALSILTKLTGVVGALPIAFGVLGVATFGLSSRFRTLVTAIVSGTVSMNANKAASIGMSTGMTGAAVATRSLSTALKGLMASTGVGLALAGVGIAAEFILNKMSSQRELSEEITQSNRELLSSYTQNSDTIDTLVGRYEELEHVMMSGKDIGIKERREYTDIQNELAEILPQLARGEDGLGNSVLATSEIVKQRVAILERQIQLEKERQALEDAANAKEAREASEKLIKDSEKIIQQQEQIANYIAKRHKVDIDISSVEGFSKLIEELQKKQADFIAQGKTGKSNEIDKQIKLLTQNSLDYMSAMNSLENANHKIAESFLTSAESALVLNDSLSNTSKNIASGFALTVGTIVQDKDKVEDFFDAFNASMSKGGSLSTDMNALGDAFVTLKEKQQEGLSTKELETYKLQAFETFETVRLSLEKMLKLNGITPETDEFFEVMTVFNNLAPQIYNASLSVDDLAKSMGVTTEQAKAMLLELGDEEILSMFADGADKSAEAVSGLSDEFKALTSSISYINGILEDYQENNRLSASTVMELIDKYPDLIAYIDDEAELIKQLEVIRNNDIKLAEKQLIEKLSNNETFYKSNLKLIEQFVGEQFKFYDGDLKQWKTLAEAKLDVEQKLIETLSKQWGVYYNTASKIFETSLNASKNSFHIPGMDAEEDAKALENSKAFDAMLSANRELQKFRDTWDSFTLDRVDLGLDKIGTSMDKNNKTTKDADKAQKDYNKTLKESIYLANTYKEAMEKLNLEQSRLNEIKSKYPTHSKEYQDALQKELAVLYEKKALIQDEAKYINAQIRTGNVAKTGVVTKGSAGTYTGKYSSEINKAAQTYGVDANLIAAIIQAESSFNPNAKSRAGAQGLMQLMPGTAKSLGVKNAYDPLENIMGGTKYIAQQLEKFGGDIKQALYAYNAGAGNVSKILKSAEGQWKEPKNYANKIINSLNQVGKVSQTAGQSMASYYLGEQFKLNSGFGKRNTGIKGASTDHKGIDLGAKAGTSIKSLRDGKVIASLYHTTGGNMVSIQQDDGTVAKYLHMQSKSKLKVGQSVKAGQEVGKVGSTGVSSGNHLHLQIEKAGKAIDPVPYLKESASAVSEASQIIAEQLQDIDSLKSDLNSKSQDIFSINEQIRAVQRAIIDVELDEFLKKHKVFQNFLDEEIAKKDSLDRSSIRYQNSLKRSLKYMGKQAEEYQKEIRFLDDLIKNGRLDAKVKEEMQEKAEALRHTLAGLNNEMRNFSAERINASQNVFAEQIADINHELERSRAILGLYEDGTIEYNQEFASQIQNMIKHQEQIKAQRESLQRSLTLHDLYPEQVKEYKEQIKQLGLEYWNLESAINGANKELKESQEKFARDLAESLISSYKSYIDEKRTMHLRSIDDEMKAEDRRHKNVMDNLREEMDTYRKIVQEMLDSIDKEESEADYNKEMSKLGEERIKLLSQLNLLSLDDSLEAKAQRKQLNEELEALDENISERRHKREVDLRKENLQEMLKDKEEAISKEEEVENKAHDEAKNRIDDLKTYWDQFYNDQLNDERKFAKLREDVMKGNFENISSEFKGYLQEMEDTMPSLENTMDGTMQAVGTSIRQNIIDNLREAMTLMSQVSGGGVASGSPSYTGGAGSPMSQPKQTLSSADIQVLTGKFYNDKLATQESNPVRKANIKEKGYELADKGRSSGSSIASNEGFDSIVAGMSQADREALGKHLAGAGSQHVSTPALQDIVKKFGQTLMSSSMKLNTGGYIKKGSSGLAMLHEEEVVLNKPETKKLFDTLPILDKLNALLAPLTMPKVNAPELAGAGGDVYEFNFHVDKMTGSEKDADNFMKTINDRLKRNKGMR